VYSVLTEMFVYRDKAEAVPSFSERIVYDPTGYEAESYRYDSRGALRSQTIYTWGGEHLVKMEVVNPFSKQRFVSLFNSDGAVTETDTYDGNGVLTAKTPNAFSVKKEETTTVLTVTNTDGTISTVERFADGSFNERTTKADGTTVLHMHHRRIETLAGIPLPPLNEKYYGSYYDSYQTTDANNRPLESCSDSPQGYSKTIYRYDGAGRETETATYDRLGTLVSQTTVKYPQEDTNGNWIEAQRWVQMGNKAAQLTQLSRRTITYYGNGHDGDSAAAP